MTDVEIVRAMYTVLAEGRMGLNAHEMTQRSVWLAYLNREINRLSDKRFVEGLQAEQPKAETPPEAPSSKIEASADRMTKLEARLADLADTVDKHRQLMKTHRHNSTSGLGWQPE